MTTRHGATPFAAGPGRRDPEPAGGPDRCPRSNRFGWGRADRDDVSPADMGRAAAGSRGGRRPATRSGSPWPTRTSIPIRSPASASTARLAPWWPATRAASLTALLCSGWISAAFREADEISDTGDPVLRYVSGRVSPEWMLPKALWLKRNEPEVYDRAERIVECTDWMMFQLTGEWTLSLNHVAVKWNYARDRTAAGRSGS